MQMSENNGWYNNTDAVSNFTCCKWLGQFSEKNVKININDLPHSEKAC
jgi:hypothetical protein